MRKNLFVAFVLAAVAAPAFGAPIYMQYEGVPGEVTVAGHDKWIELQSCAFSPQPPAIPRAPAPAGVAVGGPGSVSLVKRTDKASPLLSRAAATGKLVPAVQIDVPRPTNPNAYLRYELKNVMISSFSAGGGGSTPMESLTLNFTKIEFKYDEQKAPAGAAPPPVGYSLAGAPKTPTPSKGTTTQAPTVRR